jgi:hypothetical protein
MGSLRNSLLSGIVFGRLSFGFGAAACLSAQTFIDVSRALREGSARIVASPFDIGSIEAVFDRSPDTLARSANVNPLVITLEFNERIPITSMRLLPGDHGTWSIDGADTLDDLIRETGSYRRIHGPRTLINRSWDTISLDHTARVWRLTVNRTVGDNYVHLHEWQIGTSIPLSGLSVSSVQTEMYPTWRTTLTANGKAAVPLYLEGVQWKSLNPGVAAIGSAGTLRALAPGTAAVEAVAGAFSARWQVPVRAAARPPEIVYEPPGLATPPKGALFEIPVLVFRYLPTRDGRSIDTSYDSDFWNLGEISVEQMKQRIDSFDRRVKFMLEEGSRFRGYKNPNATPSIGYTVVSYITVYEPTPPGKPNNQSPARFFVDYEGLFERFNVRSLVENLGVKEIWFWSHTVLPDFPAYDPAYHPLDRFRVSLESEMAGPNGRICNCGIESGLPQYKKTYVLYNQNGRRTQAEVVHAHGHQLERILRHVNAYDPDTNLFVERFEGHDSSGKFSRGRCGNTHFPPNGEKDYDYENMHPFPSDCEDWLPSGGPTKPISAATWAAIPYQWPDSNVPQKTESQYYIYWMQAMPGINNQIRHSGLVMSNWWQFTADWDSTSQAGLGLMEPEEAQAIIGAAPSLLGPESRRFIVPVTLPANVKWIAVSNNHWIRVVPDYGQGGGQIEVMVDANPGVAREGSIVVAGQRISVRQAGGQGEVPPSLTGVVNAASYRPLNGQAGAGSWVTLFGSQLAEAEAFPSKGLSNQLGGIQVVYGSMPLLMSYV